jgi:hypothetical protein
MRPITIAGLTAREYDFVSNQDKHPGSCIVEVDTRSLSHIKVLAGTADGTPEGPAATNSA